MPKNQMEKGAETTANTPKKKSKSIIKSLTGHIVKTFNEKYGKMKKAYHEKAWERFPEEAKKEMLESLQKMDSVDLKQIHINTDDLTLEPGKRGEILKFKKRVLKEDSIGKYIMIDGMKCREYQPGISGFTYSIGEDNRYNPGVYDIEIMFCQKGFIKKSTIITIDGSDILKDGTF